MSEQEYSRVAFRPVWGFVLLGWLNSSCMFGWSVIRQESKGNHEAAARIADQLRIEPRGKAARARARALIHLKQHEQARAVLLRDFRHGGEIKSLVALADLELELKREGIALAHYTRVLAIDLKALRDRVPVCMLFDRRGRMMEQMGEMLAADADFRRANLICPSYSGLKGESRDQWMTLRSRVRAGARHQLSLQRRLEKSLGVPQIGELANEKTNDSPASIFHKFQLALKRQSELPLKDLIEILVAESRDELGPWMVHDKRLRAWLGQHTWLEVQPIVATIEPSAARYVQLRIGRLLNETPELRSSSISPSWRIYVLQGELEQAKIALSHAGTVPNTDLDKHENPANNEGAQLDARVQPSQLPLKIAKSRIAELEGDFASSMRLLLDVAQEEQSKGTQEFRINEVLRQLGRGQPWNALALLPESAVNSSDLEVKNLQRVGRVMLRLLQISGGESAVLQRKRAEELKGESWAKRQLNLANRLQFTTKSDRGETLQGELSRHRFASASASWRSYFQAGTSQAKSRLGQYLAMMKTHPDAIEDPKFAMLAIEEFEKDISLQFLGSWMIPLLERGGHIPLLSALMERLVHVPELVSVGQLETLGIMALALRESSRAILYFRRAAAQSTDPYTIWSNVAQWGSRFESREVELLGIKQAMMHRPEFGLFERSGWLWEAWIVRRLMDAASDPYLRKQVAHAVEAWHRDVGDYFNRVLVDQQSMQVLQVLLQIKERLSGDPKAFSMVTGLLRSGIDEGRIDQEINEGLNLLSKGSPKAVSRWDAVLEVPFDEGFVNTSSVTTNRTRSLISNAIVGSAQNRRRAWQGLLAKASTEDREKLVDILLFQNGALDLQRISREGENWGLCSFVPDELELLYMILGMKEKSKRS